MEHWSAWEATCNCKGIPGYRGKKRRSRQPRIFPEFGGKPCLGTNGQVLPVNFEREVVDCTKKDIQVFCEGQKPRALGIIVIIALLFLLQLFHLKCNYCLCNYLLHLYCNLQL